MIRSGGPLQNGSGAFRTPHGRLRHLYCQGRLVSQPRRPSTFSSLSLCASIASIVLPFGLRSAYICTRMGTAKASKAALLQPAFGSTGKLTNSILHVSATQQVQPAADNASSPKAWHTLHAKYAAVRNAYPNVEEPPPNSSLSLYLQMEIRSEKILWKIETGRFRSAIIPVPWLQTSKLV